MCNVVCQTVQKLLTESVLTLFGTLLKTAISPVLPRPLFLFISFWSFTRFYILWNNESSDKFVISNVFTTTLLSPILLGCYMEDLLKAMVKRTIGCKVDHCTGILVCIQMTYVSFRHGVPLQLIVTMMTSVVCMHESMTCCSTPTLLQVKAKTILW